MEKVYCIDCLCMIWSTKKLKYALNTKKGATPNERDAPLLLVCYSALVVLIIVGFSNNNTSLRYYNSAKSDLFRYNAWQIKR